MTDYHHPDYHHKVYANDDWFKGDEGYFVFGNVLKNDYDTYKHDLDAYVIDQPDHGKLWLDKETGQFKYEPDKGFHGHDYFEYKAYDDKGKYDTAKVKIEVKPKEKDIVDAKDDYFHVKEGKKLEGNLLKNDTDSKGHDLDIVWFSQPKEGHLKVDFETGKFWYKADKDKNHHDDKVTFEYKVSDGKGNYDTAKVVIDIKDGKWDTDRPHYDLMA